ncbi:hypothetical protein [Methylotenera sp.]|uniref:hypothetical protein n=1 Tax=Methylotenera sp. TaxID=2051956 RepID=UPI0024872CFC|nr:hypothetical protein [Methylotenera sp.]MDI1299824.1 hypothetical protein [Methylotenera sp.]
MNYITIKTALNVSCLLTTVIISSSVQAEPEANANFKLTNKYIKKSIEMSSFDEKALRWRDITISKDGKMGCATFNGKNKYGAYGGYQTVRYVVMADSVGVMENDSICYDLITESNLRSTPEGRIKYEKKQQDLADAEKLRMQKIDEAMEKGRHEKFDSMSPEQRDFFERAAADEKANKELEEKNAKDKAEMDELLRLDKLKGQSSEPEISKPEKLTPKKLFDLLLK